VAGEEVDAEQAEGDAALTRPGPAAPGLTVAAVARRLGVAPATLRTWDRRYGLGPTAHSPGAHRRYGPHDLARLTTMRRLLLEGVSAGDAARVAAAVPDGAVLVDGSAVDGSAVDGLAVDGLAVDGSAADGSAADGPAAGRSAPESAAEGGPRARWRCGRRVHRAPLHGPWRRGDRWSETCSRTVVVG
jgi:transposase-like protein